MIYNTLQEAVANWDHGRNWTDHKQSVVESVIPTVEAKYGQIERWRIQPRQVAIVAEVGSKMVMWVQSSRIFARDDLPGAEPHDGGGFDVYFGAKVERSRRSSPVTTFVSASCDCSPGVMQPVGSPCMTCETEISAS